MTKIGLEIHGYINTKEKLFCSCKSEHGAKLSKPNANICPICTGQPGAKPLLPNSSAVEKATQIALILGCKANEKMIWQRKHYSWPDLPKGYQNTISGPYANPNGVKGKFLGIGIKECHLEEDPAAWNPETGEIDYNRSGSPLIEIVTEPDFTSSEQVVEWLKRLMITLGYIKAIDKASGIKADINISLPERHGSRIEVKNVNSLRNIKTAIEFEITRQGKNVPKEQETRMFQEETGITKKMRSKEEAEDYRFISDPDLPSLTLDKKFLQKIKKNLPETPHEKVKKLIKKHKISKKHAEILTKKLEIAEFFEKVLSKTKSPIQLAVRWTTEELLRVLNYAKKEMEELDIDPYHFAELLDLIEAGKITELKAKEILNKFLPKSFSPKSKLKDFQQISGEREIKKLADEVIKKNSKAVKDFQEGEKNALNFLIGQVMKLSNKRANYATAKEILEKKLK